ENEIKTMENYFVGYETVVNFISQEELDRNHKGIPHGGFVLRSGESTDGTRHVVEYSLKLDSNPEFTGSALVAYARGIYRLAKHGGTGCYTVFDIPPAWISTHSAEELRAHSL
ncbi:MAG: diaminopimelate dehydrogenase, partial [Veillonella sp.]|nr:diaminopimelate dehydrogenase [Veillonella sp.]